MYYSEFDQGMKAFIKVLTERVLTRSQKQRKRPVSNSQKWLWLLTGVVAYERY